MLTVLTSDDVVLVDPTLDDRGAWTAYDAAADDGPAADAAPAPHHDGDEQNGRDEDHQHDEHDGLASVGVVCDLSPCGGEEKPEPTLCAGAVVRDEAGRLLLVRRGRAPAAGLWSLPGGRIEPGETPAAAAAREVREETGLQVDVGELLATVDIWGSYRVHDFTAVVVGGTLRAGDDASDARWCTEEEVVALPLSPNLLDELRRMGVIRG